MEANTKKPDIVQSFDYYIDREYYKIVSGFLFSCDRKVRADRMKDWKQWNIETEELPDLIYINGKEYKLTPLHQEGRMKI